MNFGEKLKKLREEKELTQKELAKLLDVSVRTIGYYENNGTNIPSDPVVLNKLSELFNVTLDYLLLDKENTNDFSVYHQLISKLIRDTELNHLHWEVLIDAKLIIDSFDNNFTAEESIIDLVERESSQIHLIDYNAEDSYFAQYDNGAYILLKINSENSMETLYQLYIYIKDSFYFIADDHNLEILNTLYEIVSKNSSSVSEFINKYLKDDFKKTSNFIDSDDVPF